jgi:hypothetical protein
MSIKCSSIVVGILVLLAAASCAKTPNGHLRAAQQNEAVILVGAGDIADCRDLSGAEATAKLLDEIAVSGQFCACRIED